jgi:hypothetical protein
MTARSDSYDRAERQNGPDLAVDLAARPGLRELPVVHMPPPRVAAGRLPWGLSEFEIAQGYQQGRMSRFELFVLAAETAIGIAACLGVWPLMRGAWL